MDTTKLYLDNIANELLEFEEESEDDLLATAIGYDPTLLDNLGDFTPEEYEIAAGK
jgi:hypothetical protein